MKSVVVIRVAVEVRLREGRSQDGRRGDLGRGHHLHLTTTPATSRQTAGADHSTKPEFEAPVRWWTPVISPSGAMVYDGSLFPWRGNILVGGLSSKALIRLALDGTKVTSEERIDMQHRIRDVTQARDGAVLAIADDKNGELLRLTPGKQTRD